MKRKENRGWLHVFLSYAAADREPARKLERLLARRLNVRIFSDDMLSAGEDWQTKLRKELSRCDLFMVIVSPDGLESEWVLHELGAAWALEKPIVPIVSHPDIVSRIPVELRRVQVIEIKDLDDPEVINRVLDYYEKSRLDVTTAH